MADITTCPSCNRKLQLPDALIGQDVQCPSCHATFVARVGGSSTPPPLPRSQAADPWKEETPLDGGRPAAQDWHGDDDYHDLPHEHRDLRPHRAAVILTLGILGLVFGLPAPIAWILGNIDVHEINAGRMDPEGEGVTQAGRVCGIIGTLFWGLIFMCCCGTTFMSSMRMM